MSVSVELTFTNGVRANFTPEPYFLSDKGIEGYIVVHDQLRCGFDLVKVSLEGVLFNSVRYVDRPSTQHAVARKLQVLLRMSDIKKRSDFVQITERNKRSTKCSFRFDVPKYLHRNLLGEDSEYLSDLPASLNHSEMSHGVMKQQRSSAGQSVIHYTVRVEVIRREKKIGSRIRTVRIVPALRSRPPICTADFGEEYTVRSTKTVRGTGRLALNKIGVCTIEANQPESVVLKHLYDPVNVSIPLVIKLQPLTSPSMASGSGKKDQLQFQQQCKSIMSEDGEISSALISSTYISVIPRRGVPTQSEADKIPSLARSISVCSKTTAAVGASSDWVCEPKSGTWQRKMTVNLNFHEFQHREPATPSFDSSMISYRYRVALRISLGAGSHATHSLDVPVMLRYCSGVGDGPPSYSCLPTVDVDADMTSPPSLPEDVDRRIASFDIEDILTDYSIQSPGRHDVILSELHPRAIGIAAPPYVV